MEHRLYWIPTDGGLSPALFADLLMRVSAARRARIGTLRRVTDRENALLAAVAVRIFAARAVQAKNGALQFSRTETGKPYLIGAEAFQFSPSHTDGAVALAVSPLAVGADIERLRAAPRGVAARFFTPSECVFCADDDARFFDIWTRKEAMAKRDGTPLADMLTTCDTTAASVAAETRAFFRDGFALAVASAAANEFSLCRLSVQTLADMAAETLAPID